MRRNGLALSDRATMEERFIRRRDFLTHVYMISDPVYLTEPLVGGTNAASATERHDDTYPCDPVVEVVRDPGFVPHYLPGQNPFLTEFGERYCLPREATRGGAATALPEFGETLR